MKTCDRSGDFTVSLGNICSLAPDARKKFLIHYEERKQTEILHSVFGYKATYLRCLELQARLGEVYSGRAGEV